VAGLRHHERVAQPFTLKAPDGPAWVIDPPVDPYGDGYTHQARVEIRADGLTAHTIVTIDSATPQTLAEFFGQLDADWRGWDGERRWRALEGLAIEARHDGGHVLIAVTIKHGWYSRHARAMTRDEWSARVVFTLEAGEQLRAVARELASLFGQ
jgi:hypothetical protein